MESLVHHLAEKLVQNLRRIGAQLRHGLVQSSIRSLLGGKLDRTVRQGREVLVHLIDQPVTQLAASLGVEIETHTHVILKPCHSDAESLVIPTPKVISTPRVIPTSKA